VFAYVLRRLGYGVVTVIGVLFVLFLLFFTVTEPDDIARRALGEKVSMEVIDQWKQSHGYDKPKWPSLSNPTDNMFVDHYRRMLTFDFGKSDADNMPIVDRIKEGSGPSLSLSVPMFVMGLVLGIGLALFVAFFRTTYIDTAGVFLCVLLMSVPILLYIIGAQYLIAKLLRWFPLSGYDPSPEVAARFLMMPILIGVVSGIGSSVRFYRTVFVEEVGLDYVRTARAKGAGELRVMVRHVLRNSLIPILTSVVTSIPFLFTGNLLLEAFFGIPGLGSLTFDAIQANDFSTLRTMVYIGALLFILGQIVTDISYTLVDPRVRLEGKAHASATVGRRGVWAFVGVVVGLLGLATLLNRLGAFAALRRVMEQDWHYVSNVIVVALVALGIVVGRWLARRPIWKQAVATVFRRRRLAVFVLGLYIGVALLDSIAWVGGDSGGDAVAAHQPSTLLDRIFSDSEERTFSAPLASNDFYGDADLRHPGTHLLGTDKLGRDVLYMSLKGARVALLIGGLTSLIAIPLALLFGVAAGYFGGWVDDVVFFVVSTLASIPSLLLLIALILVLGKGTWQVCLALAVTSWVGFCRITRGETFKLRELDFIHAARLMGLSEFKIVLRHVLPNLMHLVLITFVLLFSGLVITESILSWLLIGADGSWGQMIAQAKDELAREPIVWWNVTGAFIAMFGLLLVMNLISDTVRDVLDPRTAKEQL
jgi:peptide/nickel transport system permease protein